MRGSLLDQKFRHALIEQITGKNTPTWLDESLPDYDIELRLHGLYCGRASYRDLCLNLKDKGVDLRERAIMANSLN